MNVNKAQLFCKGLCTKTKYMKPMSVLKAAALKKLSVQL